jgi:hypothetical protein
LGEIDDFITICAQKCKKTINISAAKKTPFTIHHPPSTIHHPPDNNHITNTAVAKKENPKINGYHFSCRGENPEISNKRKE